MEKVFKVGERVRVIIPARYRHPGALPMKGCIGRISNVRKSAVGYVYSIPSVLREDGPYAYSWYELEKITPANPDVPECKSIRERRKNPKIFVS